MSQTSDYEAMLVEVKELGMEGLNVVVYDTRDDDEATFTAGVSAHEPSANDPDWRKQAPSELNKASLLQYIDHEWRNVAVEYTEEGLIKEGPAINQRHEAILVSDPTTLAARIERLSDCFIVTVEADGATKFETTLSDAELSLETHPELRD